MSFDRAALINAVIGNLGQAAGGVAQSEIEEVVYDLVGDGLDSFPKAARFLAKLPKVSRRVGVVALVGVLKANPNILGAENAPYVRAVNEIIESFAEGIGRAVADISEEDGRQMAEAVTRVGETTVIVFEKIAHGEDGACVDLQDKKVAWLATHPPTPKRVGTGNSQRTVMEPGEPFPEIKGLTVASAIEQGVTPCPKCMKHYIRLPEWARPPKPKSFEETLNNKERWVFGRLCDRAMTEGGLAAQLVQQASEQDKWNRVRLLRDLLEEGEQGQEPSDDFYRRFVRRVDAVFNPTFVDQLAGYLDTFIKKVRAWLSGQGWKTTALVVGAAALVVFVVICVVALIYLGFAGYGCHLFFQDGWYHGQFMPWMGGSVLLFFVLILLLPLQGLVDWIMDQGRIVGRRLGFAVTPETNSWVWLKNFGLSGGFFVLFWGAIGLITIGLGGGIKARALMVISSMLSTAGLVGYAQIKRMDLWEKGFLRTVGLAGVVSVFALVGAVTTLTEWNWRPLRVEAVSGQPHLFVVVNPNPPHDKEGYKETYSLPEVFGPAVVRYGLVQVEGDGRVSSKTPLVAGPMDASFRVRTREDGFDHFVYDIKPDRFHKELAEARVKAKQVEELAAVAETGNKSHTSWWLWPTLALGVGALALVVKSFFSKKRNVFGRLESSGPREGFAMLGGLLLTTGVLWLIVAGIVQLCKDDDPSPVSHQQTTVVTATPATPTLPPARLPRPVLRRETTKKRAPTSTSTAPTAPKKTTGATIDYRSFYPEGLPGLPGDGGPAVRGPIVGYYPADVSRETAGTTGTTGTTSRRHYPRETCLRLPDPWSRDYCLSKAVE
jgi:hypothetical protein